MPTTLDDYSGLAVCDDPRRAMHAVTEKLAARGFGVRSLATWHDGQTPSRPWGHDRRRHATGVTGRSTAKIIRQRHAKTLR